MGIFGKSSPYQVILEPFDPPIGFNTAFCSPNIETLHMKEKFSSFKDVDIAIKNEAGQQVLTCHCKGGSFTNKKGETFCILSPQPVREGIEVMYVCVYGTLTSMSSRVSRRARDAIVHRSGHASESGEAGL